jgi:stearoyl-CoA desaturase (delta-9 desaturase)
MIALAPHWRGTAEQFGMNSGSVISGQTGRPVRRIDWLGASPFIAIHVLAFGCIWTGITPAAAICCVALYFIRMFAVTGGYHRYFSHRTYKTSRAFQFVLAFVAQTSAQRGALWWAAHHRNHHLYSDQPQDIHSPVQDGFWYSHVLWLFDTGVPATDYRNIPDLARYPELRFLNKYYLLPPILLGALVFFTLGAPGLFFGFFVSTVLLWHGTFTINSLSHVFGGRRYATSDDSRNNWLLAIVTMGEGWHNNHHRFSSSTRQGFYWYEYDFTYYILKLLSWMGLVWQLRPVPVSILQEGRRNEALHGVAGAPIAPHRGAVGTVGAEPG